MTDLHYFDEHQKPDASEQSGIIRFLHENLDQYGDKEEDIGKAVSFALGEGRSFGGFVLVSRDNSTRGITGALVVNQTGMKGYIPENILVYIATRKDQRGKGIGKKLMQAAIDRAEGNIALHVEPDNPARYLYEKIGFENKYLEMRLIRS